jgi:hypothetical protein
MWEPQRLTTLWASTASYRASSIFNIFYIIYIICWIKISNDRWDLTEDSGFQKHCVQLVYKICVAQWTMSIAILVYWGKYCHEAYGIITRTFIGRNFQYSTYPEFTTIPPTSFCLTYPSSFPHFSISTPFTSTPSTRSPRLPHSTPNCALHLTLNEPWNSWSVHNRA